MFSLLQRELTDVLSLQPKIETVRASCSALMSQPSAPDFVQQAFDGLLGRYQAVRQNLEDHQRQLENGKPILLVSLLGDFTISSLILT